MEFWALGVWGLGFRALGSGSKGLGSGYVGVWVPSSFLGLRAIGWNAWVMVEHSFKFLFSQIPGEHEIIIRSTRLRTKNAAFLVL